MDDIDVRDLDPRLTVSVRVVVPAAELDLAALFDRHLPTIAARLAEGGIAWDGAPFGRYHKWTAERVDVEMGIPVGEPPVALPDLADVPPGELGRSMLPGGRAAVLVHRGSYRGLPASWDRLHAWMRD